MAVFNIKDKKSMSDYFAYTRSCSFTITEINDIFHQINVPLVRLSETLDFLLTTVFLKV